MATRRPRTTPFETASIATGSLSLPIRQGTLTRESNSEIEEEIETIEGKNVRKQAAFDKLVKKNSNSSLQSTSTFKYYDSLEEELGWFFPIEKPRKIARRRSATKPAKIKIPRAPRGNSFRIRYCTIFVGIV